MRRILRTIKSLWARLSYRYTGECGYLGCGYEEPYGFVAEDGCPIHNVSVKDEEMGKPEHRKKW